MKETSMTTFKYSVHSGYECSSKGDKRFSAFFARMPDGKSIEHHYQVNVKGYPSIEEGKGKPPLKKMSTDALYERYLDLWRQWACLHPQEIEELRYHASQCGYVLRDRFATSHVNQARALAQILNETPPPEQRDLEMESLCD